MGDNRQTTAEPMDTEVNERKSTTDPPELPSDRFELELEFLQMLASPAYLHYLAINEYLSDSAFMDFLKYLRYWKQPEYVKFVSYPHSLYFLDLLTENERFRRELKNVAFRGKK